MDLKHNIFFIKFKNYVFGNFFNKKKILAKIFFNIK